MTSTRVYFRPTTAPQRRLLFATWVATGDRKLACAKARVCERTFYKWKPRFEQHGFPGLDECASHAPKVPARLSVALAEQIVALRQAHPAWGKLRIAQQVNKAHGWQNTVAPNTVKRVLRDAGLWTVPPAEETEKRGPKS